MNPDITFLLSIVIDSVLYHEALHIDDRNLLPGDLEDCPMEPEHRAWLMDQRPSHAQKGRLVWVKIISDCHFVQLKESEK